MTIEMEKRNGDKLSCMIDVGYVYVLSLARGVFAEKCYFTA